VLSTKIPLFRNKTIRELSSLSTLTIKPIEITQYKKIWQQIVSSKKPLAICTKIKASSANKEFLT